MFKELEVKLKLRVMVKLVTKILRHILLLLVIFIPYGLLGQNLKTAAIFGNNMVIQQQINAPIWGMALPGEKIQIKFAGLTASGIADKNGKWMIYLSTQSAGGPYNMVVNTTHDSLFFNNVMVGEVWLASGQSNMNMSIAKIENKDVVANAQKNDIRIFTVNKNVSGKPLNDLNPIAWKVTNAENVLEFSAVAYFFAKKLNIDKNVAVGIINASRSGTPAEAWTSAEMLLTLPDFKQKVIEQQLQTKDWAELEEQGLRTNEEYRKIITSSTVGIEKKVHLLKYNDANWALVEYPLLASKMGMNSNGLVWVRKVIDIPSSACKTDLQLYLGTVIQEDITYFNGQRVGSCQNEGKRIYTIPNKFLKPGKNVVAIRLLTEWGYGRIGNPDDEPLLYSNDKKFVLSLKGEWSYNSLLEPTLPVNKNYALEPSSLFNGMIAPIIPYGIRGALWYQGEGNSGNPEQYEALLPALFTDWRVRWRQGYFPFLIVQLPNYAPGGSNWARMREVQMNAMSYPNVGIAVTIDLGEPYDVHPKNKEAVGLRLYKAAQKIAYSENTSCSGPIYAGMHISNETISIQFDNIGRGLVLKSADPSSSFQVAGIDQKFYPATQVQIIENEIVISCSNVPKPVFVRYAWGGNPSASIYDLDGFPASPFRTDDIDD